MNFFLQIWHDLSSFCVNASSLSSSKSIISFACSLKDFQDSFIQSFPRYKLCLRSVWSIAWIADIEYPQGICGYFLSKNYWQQIVIKKRRNAKDKTTQKLSNFSEEQNRKRQNAWKWYRSLFKENKLNEEEKNKNHQYACNLDNNLSEEKKDKKREYARERYRNLFGEEKGKKCQYAHKRYRNISKNPLVEEHKIAII